MRPRGMLHHEVLSAKPRAHGGGKGADGVVVLQRGWRERSYRRLSHAPTVQLPASLCGARDIPTSSPSAGRGGAGCGSDSGVAAPAWTDEVVWHLGLSVGLEEVKGARSGDGGAAARVQAHLAHRAEAGRFASARRAGAALAARCAALERLGGLVSRRRRRRLDASANCS